MRLLSVLLTALLAATSAAHSRPKPAIVLVHGAWVDVSFWNVTAAKLRQHGYTDIVIPEFISNRITDPATSTHRADVALVQRQLKPLVDAGKDVVVVMHSYGGLVGSDSIEGFAKGSVPRGGVIAAVYHTAFVVKPGNNILSAFANGPPPTFIQPDPTHPFYTTILDPRTIFFNDFTDAQAAPYLAHIRPAANGTFTSAARYAPWKDVPCSYLFATEDNAIPLAGQQGMFEAVQAESKYDWVTGDVHGGHASAISRAEEVVAFVERAARG